jgi:hypothetical protein
MDDASALVLEYEEHEKDAKRRRWHDKKVNGNKVLGVVAEKRPPGLRRRLSPRGHVPRDRSFTDLEAELE